MTGGNLPTVQMIQRLTLPAGTRLLGGAAGLGREVSWPAALRTRAPAFTSLKGAELLLVATASLGLLDPSLTLLRLLQGVARVGISGVAVLGEVPAEAANWADDHDLPLFQLPSSVHLPEVESAIARAIADSRSELARRAHELYRQLTQVAIEGRGLAAIVDELARVTGKVAFNLDHALALESCSARTSEVSTIVGGLKQSEAALQEWLARAPASVAEPPVRVFATEPGGSVLLAPLLVRDGVVGYVGVISGGAVLDDLDRAAVGGAAAAGAIELARERAVLDAEERAQAGLVEDLLSGSQPESEALRRRAARQQVDLAATHVVGVQTVLREALTPGVLDAFGREARALLGTVQVGVVDGCLVWLATNATGNPEAAGETLRVSLARKLAEPTLSAGVGRPLPALSGLRQSYREATEALSIGRSLFGPGRTTAFANLGLYRLLLELRGNPELTRFHRETIGKIEQHDQRSDGELLRTLDAYFACNGSPTEAAARLHVHRNTLLYRLQRIRAVAELDLDDPEVRLSLQIALRIRLVLQVNGGER
jgi:purine catabolism regulator